MNRGAFVMELLSLWEQSAAQMRREGYPRAAEEISAAIRVLEKTYNTVDLEKGLPDLRATAGSWWKEPKP